ncbi:hypothetical protein ACFWZ2_42935 [Streptomyces sp. NPDC059002]|uniref:hypothetical protein n=1 Tax=Streptomyces sp. NPDC059002 TaxID=3346690 RepID=UPI00369DB335
MHPVNVAELASKTDEHGPMFLGHDVEGWSVALIAAILAAVFYEVIMALTRGMTLRLPFLILKFARLAMPKEDWEYQGPEWEAELWNYLGDRNHHWFLRFIDGMTFAIPLAAGGARHAAQASRKAARGPRPARAPKRGRHAARGRRAGISPTELLVCTSSAIVSLGVTAAVSAGSRTATSPPAAEVAPWVWWLGIGVMLIAAAVLFLSLAAHESRHASRESDHGK